MNLSSIKTFMFLKTSTSQQRFTSFRITFSSPTSSTSIATSDFCLQNISGTYGTQNESIKLLENLQRWAWNLAHVLNPTWSCLWTFQGSFKAQCCPVKPFTLQALSFNLWRLSWTVLRLDLWDYNLAANNQHQKIWNHLFPDPSDQTRPPILSAAIT